MSKPYIMISPSQTVITSNMGEDHQTSQVVEPEAIEVQLHINGAYFCSVPLADLADFYIKNKFL